ncbi:MAG: hypothetical protein JNM86_08845 [Phycisphaerae bacterium]|nr:hypothetical protein [Phycisphaerae bacterium]MBN8597881.1 hypothetical protein [Planctomycetota bacterium]
MRKIAIVLDVVLLIVVFAGLAIAQRNGRLLTYEDFLLPGFGLILLIALADPSPLKTTTR